MKCPMQIIIFLGLDDYCYLSTKSCLDHHYHPFIKADAILCMQSDMEQSNINLMFLLFSEATHVQISQIMEHLKGPELGTLLPKQIYNMKQKAEQLQELAGKYQVIPMQKKS
jgi:hypothetical protein